MGIARRFSAGYGPICAALLLLALAAPMARTAGEKVRFAPHYAAGQTFYYRIQTRTTTTGKTTTPIDNPEGETKTSQDMNLLVRLEVIGVLQGLPGTAQVRFRETFERASAQSDSDAFDPGAPSTADQYKHAEGNSIEFTLQPDGQLAELNGPGNVFPNLSPIDPLLAWAGVLATGGRLPREGVSVGQKWNSERQIAGVPLSGVVWRMESTYSRNDACPPGGADENGKGPGAARTPAAGANDCALILTRFEILRHGSNRPDSTPEEFRRNGLRTSGTWSGSGESLETISLATGYLESSTQTSTQNLNYEIVSASKGTRIHRVGKVESQTEIRQVSVRPSVQ